MSGVEIELTEAEALKIMRALAARFPAAAVVVGDEAQNRAAPADRSAWQHPLDVAAMESALVALGRRSNINAGNPQELRALTESVNQAIELLALRIGGRARGHELLRAAGRVD